MAVKQGVALAALSGLSAIIAACGNSRATSHDHGARSTALPTPTLAQQVRRAERAGPGILDECPTNNGRRTGKYDVSVPGSALVPGWCQTTARRELSGGADTVSFRIYWDARRVTGQTYIYALTYSVPRRRAMHVAPVPTLTGESGNPAP